METDRSLSEHYGRDAETHPEADAWERLAMGECGEPERERLFEHAARCARCAPILKGLLALESEALRADPQRERVLSRTPSGWGRPGASVLLAAAAAAIVAAVGWSVLAPDAPDAPGERPAAVRSAERPRPSARAPTGRLTEAPGSFAWTAAEPGSRFSVELLDADGSPLWRSEPTGASSLVWPESVAPRPGRYYWRVFETGRDGEVTVSEMTAFDLLAP